MTLTHPNAAGQEKKSPWYRGMGWGVRAVGLENRSTFAAHLDVGRRGELLFGRDRWSGSPLVTAPGIPVGWLAAMPR